MNQSRLTGGSGSEPEERRERMFEIIDRQREGTVPYGAEVFTSGIDTLVAFTNDIMNEIRGIEALEGNKRYFRKPDPFVRYATSMPIHTRVEEKIVRMWLDASERDMSITSGRPTKHRIIEYAWLTSCKCYRMIVQTSTTFYANSY